MYVTADTLVRLGCAASRAPEVARLLNDGLLRHNVSDPDQIAMFVGNLAHESRTFNAAREIISERTANANYGNRMGNVNTGDGYRFRGAGWVQLTGRSNFEGFERYVNANLASFGLTRRVDFTSSNAAADQVGELPWAAHATFWYKFVAWGTLNRQSLDRHDFLMHCFVTNYPAAAQDIAEGKRPRLSLPNGWDDRERKYNLAKEPIQQNYVAWVRAGSPRPAGGGTAGIPQPVTTAGPGAILDRIFGALFGKSDAPDSYATPPATPSPAPTSIPVTFPDFFKVTVPPFTTTSPATNFTGQTVAPSLFPATGTKPVTSTPGIVSTLPGTTAFASAQTTAQQKQIIDGIDNKALVLGVLGIGFALSRPAQVNKKRLGPE